MKQYRQRSVSHTARRSAAARMTAFTAAASTKQALLLDQAGRGFRRARRDRVVRGTTQHRDGLERVEVAQFVAAQPLQLWRCISPSLHPASADDNLFRSPILKRGGSLGHN